jgi:O-succinylbenzoic acid--CoA ligase
VRVVRAVPDELAPALEDALDGGEPVLPLPLDEAEAARVLRAVRPDEPLEPGVCLVVPTSGSTGEPKGVLLTPECLRASATATLARLGGPGQWDLRLPVTHIAGIQVLVRRLLGTGPRRYTAVVPTQLQRSLDELRAYDAVLVGGAATTPALLAQARAVGVRVVTTYGMSETSGGCVYDGVPLDGVSIGGTDPIVVSGPVVARGYRFGAAFDGRFTTSDLGRLVDGRLEVLGRVDDVVITGGENVAPAAVEAALSSHPSVVEVCVVGVPDPEWGSRVVAAVVLRSPLTLEAAREWVAERVSRVAAPRELRVLDALPLLPSGKVDRRALRGWGA